MKKIDTSAINSASWLPVLGNFGGNNFVTGLNPGSFAGLDFLQQAYFECINALSQFIVNDQAVPTIMYIAPPPTSSGPFRVATTTTEGFINYQGEVYYFSTSREAIPIFDTETRYQNASIVTDFSSSDPITFSDLAKNNVHQVRQVQLSWSNIRNAGNIPDFDLWMNATANSYGTVLAQTILNDWVGSTYNTFVSNYNTLVAGLVPATILVPSSGDNCFQNSWTNSIGIRHSLVNACPLSYNKVLNRVYIWGEISNSHVDGESIIFTLPAAYRPIAYEEVFEVCELSTVTSTGNQNGTPQYYLVITNDPLTPGAVKLLSSSASPHQRSISLSGISFAQGDYTTIDYTSLETEIIDFDFLEETDDE